MAYTRTWTLHAYLFIFEVHPPTHLVPMGAPKRMPPCLQKMVHEAPGGVGHEKGKARKVGGFVVCMTPGNRERKKAERRDVCDQIKPQPAREMVRYTGLQFIHRASSLDCSAHACDHCVISTNYLSLHS